VDILSIGTSSYNALQMQYTQRGNKYLNILSSYTYSRAIDVDTNGQTTSNAVPDVFNIQSDRGLSDNNATHIFSLGWVVRYPKVASGSRFVRATLNNWVYSGTYQWHTGLPFSVLINNDSALDGESNQRPRWFRGRIRFCQPAGVALPKLLNTSTGCVYLSQGWNLQSDRKECIYRPSYIMTNMTIVRDFPLSQWREGMRLNIRVEGYNVFNTPNLSPRPRSPVRRRVHC
jgi:hypothetical protein